MTLNNNLCKRIWFYKKSNCVSFITFTLSTLFISSVLFLFYSNLTQTVNANQNNMILLFIILFAMTYLLCNLLTLIIIKMNMEMRVKDIITERILGFSKNKIFRNILSEQLVILIPSLILGILLSIPLNDFLSYSLKGLKILANDFKINYSAIVIVAIVLSATLLLILLVVMTTNKYKNVFISTINNGTEAKKNIILKSVFSILFLTAALCLFIFTRTEVVFLFGGIFFAIAILLGGKYFVKLLLLILIKSSKRNQLFNISLQNIKNNINQIINIIFIIIIVFVFVNFSINVIGQMSPGAVEKLNDDNQIYLNGLKFLTIVISSIVATFGCLIIINSLVLYYGSIAKENNDLLILGFDKKRIFIKNVIQALFILIVGLLFALTPTLFMAMLWNNKLMVNNCMLWLTLSLSTVLLFTIVTLAVSFRSIKK